MPYEMGIFSFFVSFLEVLLVRSSRGTRSGRQRKLLVQLVSVHFLREKTLVWTPESSSWPQLQLPLSLCVGVLESQLPFPAIHSAVTFGHFLVHLKILILYYFWNKLYFPKWIRTLSSHIPITDLALQHQQVESFSNPSWFWAGMWLLWNQQNADEWCYVTCKAES